MQLFDFNDFSFLYMLNMKNVGNLLGCNYEICFSFYTKIINFYIFIYVFLKPES